MAARSLLAVSIMSMQQGDARPPARRRVGLNTRADEFLAGPYDPEADTAPDGRHARRLFWADGFMSNFSDAFIVNFQNPFALSLGATNLQMGVLSAVSNLASAIGLFPGARLDDGAWSRKRIVVVMASIGRLLLLAIAAIPLLFGGSAAIYAFMLLIALRAFFSQMLFPSWSAFVADLVPTAIRGRYFAARNIGLAIAALIAAPLAGRIAETIGLPYGYQVIFVLACVSGLIASAIFARIPEPPRARPLAAAQRPQERLWALLKTHPRFTAFTAVGILWNLALMVAGPFFSVYIVRNLGASPTQIGLLAASNSLANIVGQQIWGRLNDRHGPRVVMLVTGLLIPLIPMGYWLAPNPWFLIGVEALSGFCWSGYSLANFNLMLGLTPAEGRARYTAIFQAGVFGASFVGPLLGSLLVSLIDIRPLFVISALGRLIATLLFLITVRGDVER